MVSNLDFRLITRNILGGFSDGAILFPILALLSAKAGYSDVILLLTTGLAFVVSAAVFRVPMSVQPLKSIAIAAIAVGASFEEVRLSGLLLGLACLTMGLFRIDRLIARVPTVVVHQLQIGLGTLLILQGLKTGGEWTMISSIGGLATFGAVGMMVFLPELGGIPILGLIATAGMLVAIISPAAIDSSALASPATATLRAPLVLGLLMPQIVLTSANSVLATRDVCVRYFGAGAERVTIRRLLNSIGLGNIFMAAVGGMPFCHGSGGVTAHVRGGASSPWSTAFMGACLVLLALIEFVGHRQILSYPVVLVAPLLMAVGIFHFKLAAGTMRSQSGLLKVGSAVIITVITKNLLWVLSLAILYEVLFLVVNTSDIDEVIVNDSI